MVSAIQKVGKLLLLSKKLKKNTVDCHSCLISLKQGRAGKRAKAQTKYTRIIYVFLLPNLRKYI